MAPVQNQKEEQQQQGPSEVCYGDAGQHDKVANLELLLQQLRADLSVYKEKHEDDINALKEDMEEIRARSSYVSTVPSSTGQLDSCTIARAINEAEANNNKAISYEDQPDPDYKLGTEWFLVAENAPLPDSPPPGRCQALLVDGDDLKELAAWAGSGEGLKVAVPQEVPEIKKFNDAVEVVVQGADENEEEKKEEAKNDHSSNETANKNGEKGKDQASNESVKFYCMSDYGKPVKVELGDEAIEEKLHCPMCPDTFEVRKEV